MKKYRVINNGRASTKYCGVRNGDIGVPSRDGTSLSVNGKEIWLENENWFGKELIFNLDEVVEVIDSQSNRSTVNEITASIVTIDNKMRDINYVTISDKNKIIESINDLKASLDSLVVIDLIVLNNSYLDANYIDSITLNLYYKSEIEQLWYWWNEKWVECDWEYDDDIVLSQFLPISIKKREDN